MRGQAADKLEARGRVLAADRWTDWSQNGMVARAERTGRPLDGPAFERLDAANDVGGAGRSDASSTPSGARASKSTGVAGDGDGFPRDEHIGAPSKTTRTHSKARRMQLKPTRWHASRAKNKRELFERIAACGDQKAHTVTLVCRECGDETAVPLGCSSHWFCAKCRQRTAQRFRDDFSRKRMGLLNTTARAGLTRRKQKRENRWMERFVTFTLPHTGGVRTRIQTVRATWARFWRTLQDELRGSLNKPSGIFLEDLPASKDRDGLKLAAKEDPTRELSLFEVLSYLHVLEWTPGDDGQGHPHLHVWIFSPRLDQAMLERLWRAAYAHVTEQPLDRVGKTIVHIEAAKDGIEHELIKYLTKDWEMTPDGAKRVAPEVFAQVYAELDGKRLRQSSARFARWAVSKARFCPCCGFENERGHWARVDIEHHLDGHAFPIGKERTPEQWAAWLADVLKEHERTPAPLTAADLQAFQDNLTDQDRDWCESVERKIVAGQMRKALAGEPLGRFVLGAEAKRLGLDDGAYVPSAPKAPAPAPRGLLALTNEALAWTTVRARPELVELVSNVLVARKMAHAEAVASEYIETFSRVLAWHVSYAFARCYQGASSEAEAARLFRSEEINGELRRTVLRMTRRVLEKE